VTFAASLLLWFQFERGSASFQFLTSLPLLGSETLALRMGVDGISVLLILLSTLLTTLCILASWSSIKTRVRAYMIAFLLLESLMIGTFAALDLFLFYLFFEAVLIPMFLIIGIWGGKNRVYAAYKFFLYTLAGSVLMLVALFVIFARSGTADLTELAQGAALGQLPLGLQIWLWLALFASFAVKIPMWPSHTWLPDAHVEAPTAGSVILAGVLLKMGGYGFLRLSLPILPLASELLAPLIFVLSIIAVVYTSLVALVQQDMKKLIAYSSVAHMAFVTVGIFTFTPQGLAGGLFQMLSHGLVSGALFLIVGVVYDRLHTREIARYGGLADLMPSYALLFMLFTMASVGLPGTSGFVGEFLVLVGAWGSGSWLAAGTALGLILGAAYMLWLYRKVVFGALRHADLKASMTDLHWREWLVFTPLVLLVLWLGIFPNPALDIMQASLDRLIAVMAEAGVAVPQPGQGLPTAVTSGE
jgi:NADH-quinone oxidoreductase subunit M